MSQKEDDIWLSRGAALEQKKTAVNLLDISDKLTVRNYHCHLLSSSLEIAALDLCAQTDICLGLHVSMFM